MINIFVLVTILGHLPVILSAKRKGSDNMKQILIVEDDNLLNKTLTYNLELDGYTITSVLNARTAAESLKTNIFDLVLLDINLPDGNGYDLCRLIKPEHPDTVVIFLTANDQESDQIRGYEAGAIYNIIDSRYRSHKPLIVTTNLTLTELKNPQDTTHARIYDRLLELCTPIACTGPSMRKNIGQGKLDFLKTLLV